MAIDLFRSLVPDITRHQLEELMTALDSRDLDAASVRMNYYRNELEPLHPQSMSDDTWRDRVNAWVGVPLPALFVNTIGAALYNRDIDRTTGNEAYDKALADIYKAAADVMLQNAKLASIIGDTVIRIMPDWQKGLRLSVWDGRHIIPIYDPDDPQEVVGLIYDYVADPVVSQIARAVAGHGATEDRIEIITRHIRDRETGRILIPGIRARFVNGKRVPWNADTAADAFNPFGDYLDGVFWRNLTDPTGARGQSDLEHLLPLFQGVNEATTDAKLLLSWNIYPIIWTTADMEEEPEYSHKAVWQLGDKSNGQTAEAGMLEWSGNMEGFRTHYEHLLALLHECGRLPAIATGDLTHIGDLSSGRAYEIAMRPYLDMLAERERICETQELAMMRTMIAVLAYMGKAPFTGLTANYGLGFYQPDPVRINAATADADIVFAPIRLADDSAVMAQTHSTRIGAGYESTETAIRETHPDWTDERVAEELERVGGGKTAETDAAADLRIAEQQKAIAEAAAKKQPPA